MYTLESHKTMGYLTCIWYNKRFVSWFLFFSIKIKQVEIMKQFAFHTPQILFRLGVSHPCALPTPVTIVASKATWWPEPWPFTPSFKLFLISMCRCNARRCDCFLVIGERRPETSEYWRQPKLPANLAGYTCWWSWSSFWLYVRWNISLSQFR